MIYHKRSLWALFFLLNQYAKNTRFTGGVSLHNLETTDGSKGDKKIRAFITTKTDNDNLIESLLTKVGKSENIISAGWKVVDDE